ncbi:MAG: hypothetical protein IKF78_07420 [Atopobiaceae bacterium]|nr:hypothetical protein [Atopobiaceae bacterium]
MTIKKTSALLAALTLCLTLVSCGNTSSQASSQSSTASSAQSSSQTRESAQSETPTKKAVAKDDANMQTQDASMPTRLPMEGGTKINMHFGDTVIPGVLNDSETAKALIAKLPITQHVSRYSHDFCGVTEELPYSQDEVHYGWLNGDIDYATDAPYFTILFEDQDVSEQYGSQVNIGVITCPLKDIATLEGSFDVRIELAE